MDITKFIDKVKVFLELDGFEKATKEKSVKKLLKKLIIKEKNILESLKNSQDKKQKEAMQEDLDIIVKQIKKGKKLLEENKN